MKTDAFRFDEVISLLDSDTALVEFFPMIGETVAFIFTKESIDDVRLCKCQSDMSYLNAMVTELAEGSRAMLSGNSRNRFSEFLDRILKSLYVGFRTVWTEKG